MPWRRTEFTFLGVVCREGEHDQCEEGQEDSRDGEDVATEHHLPLHVDCYVHYLVTICNIQKFKLIQKHKEVKQDDIKQ